ncbi:MAG: hypothetical protein WBW99_02470 [Pseudolabrys sp.]
MTEGHEFVRRYAPRREEVDAAANPSAENLNSLIRRVAGASVEEIEQVILELQSVRDILNRESVRLRAEITPYASLNQHLMTGMNIIAENVKAMGRRGRGS